MQLSLHQLNLSAMPMAKGLWPGVPLPHLTVELERVGDHNPGSVVGAEDSVGNLGHCTCNRICRSVRVDANKVLNNAERQHPKKLPLTPVNNTAIGVASFIKSGKTVNLHHIERCQQVDCSQVLKIPGVDSHNSTDHKSWKQTVNCHHNWNCPLSALSNQSIDCCQKGSGFTTNL